MSTNSKVTITFTREDCENDNPDLSWLEQKDAEMGEGFEADAEKRLLAYQCGDWRMIGIRAKATIWVERSNYRTSYEVQSGGLWGIESDSGEEYLNEVFAEECATLRADIEAMKTAEFKS